MKKILPLITFLFGVLITVAQEKIPLIDYDSIYKKISISVAQGNYEKTLAQLNTINKNDSIYCTAMVRKSYYLMVLKRYDEAIATTNEGLNSGCYGLRSSFYINKTASQIRQGKNEEALQVCEEGLKQFPQNKTLWYNKGVAHEDMGDVEEAVAAYEKTIRLDPLYTKTYLQLGNLCYKQELISQALMCYNMYLLLETDSAKSFGILKSLNNAVQGKNEYARNPDIKISDDDETFEEIDLILNNRIALNQKYETGNDINIALTKQNHALLTSLKDFSGNNGFWDTKFVPFYQWVMAQGYFDAFTYTLSFSIENEAYKKIIEKKEDEIQDFFTLAKEKWIEITSNNPMTKNGKNGNLNYYFEEGYTQGIGKTENGVIVGPWELFNKSGGLTGKGSFSDEGNRTGYWEFYNAQGNIIETAEYLNGNLNGQNIVYFDNGKQKIVANYKDDDFDGEYLYYGETGALEQKKYFKNGKLHGTFKSFHAIGEALVESEAEYVDGNIKEMYRSYFPTGKLSSEITFKNGKAEGREARYHLNGTLQKDLSSKNGWLDGYYKTFHPNGKAKEVGQTFEGDYVGRWQTFYSNGTLESDFTYGENSEIDGEYKYYDIDGKLHYIFEYRKGEFIAYKYFDKEGNVIEENRKKGGEFYYKGYSPYGKIKSEGLYDIKGGTKGKWKYYTKHGILDEEGTYDDNQLQGEYKTYYANGELSSMYHYKNDTLNGYYASYHRNGKIKRQGWYKENNLHGEWKSYTPNGVVTEINFYHKGLLHGEQLLFSGKGVKTLSSIYEYDDKLKEIYYTRDGNISFTVNFKSDKETYELVYQHQNKKPSTTVTYVNGVKHGPYAFHDFYGRKVTEGNYLNGKLHGELTWYYDDGAVEVKANYTYGELDGDYIYYYEDGSVESKYYYSLGKVQGEIVNYYENGNLQSKGQYHDDKRHGRREDYGPSGNLQLVRFYQYGRFIGYSYLDKNSKELPMIPIENETAKITTYYDNGKVSREMEYENGSLINDFKEFYYTGQLFEEINYVAGEFHGKAAKYFPDGMLEKESNYEMGDLNGIAKTYFKNGKLKKEETYLHNIKEGATKTYNEEGKLLMEETYSNGDIIASK